MNELREEKSTGQGLRKYTSFHLKKGRKSVYPMPRYSGTNLDFKNIVSRKKFFNKFLSLAHFASKIAICPMHF